MSLSIYVMKAEPEDIAREYVFWEYGPNFDISSKARKEDNKILFPLNTELKEEVKDSKTERIYKLRTKFYNVGSIAYNEETSKLETPMKGDIYESIRVKIQEIQRSIEKEVIKAESERFGELILTKQMFSPIRRMLLEIRDHEHAMVKEYSNYPHQLNLLLMTNMISKDGNRLVPTIWFTQTLKSLDSDFSRFQACVLGKILAQNFDYVVEEANIKQVLPYSRLAVSYYRPAKEANDLIWIGVKELYQNYCKVYPTLSRGHFDSYLDELTTSRILNREKDEVCGNESTLRMVEKGSNYVSTGPSGCNSIQQNRFA